MKGMPRKPPRPRTGGAAFPPLSDQELVEFLRELTETLPGDLAETVIYEAPGGRFEVAILAVRPPD